MKLIIDIPEYEYLYIKEIYEKNDNVEATYSYIYHGTPLEQEPKIEQYQKEIDHLHKYIIKLETQIVEQQPCEDAVSRSEALKAIDSWDKFEYSTQHGLINISKDDKVYAPYVHYDDMVECIKNLSPVTQQASEEDIHREREQAYMLGYEDASKKFRTEPCEDCISRQAVIEHICENKECYKEECKGRILKRCPDLQWVFDLPSVTPKIEACGDCISRAEAIEWMENIRTLNQYYHPKENDDETLVSEVISRLEQLPPVTPKRPKGKWIEYEVDIAPHPLHCSLCGFSNHHISNRYTMEFRRCPNCGAEMSGGGEEG